MFHTTAILEVKRKWVQRVAYYWVNPDQDWPMNLDLRSTVGIDYEDDHLQPSDENEPNQQHKERYIFLK
jgi:hypothetical protein